MNNYNDPKLQVSLKGGFSDRNRNGINTFIPYSPYIRT